MNFMDICLYCSELKLFFFLFVVYLRYCLLTFKREFVFELFSVIGQDKIGHFENFLPSEA